MVVLSFKPASNNSSFALTSVIAALYRATTVLHSLLPTSLADSVRSPVQFLYVFEMLAEADALTVYPAGPAAAAAHCNGPQASKANPIRCCDGVGFLLTRDDLPQINLKAVQTNGWNQNRR